MDQRHIGIILIITSVLIGGFVYSVHADDEAVAEAYMEREGTCILEDGTCLHKRNMALYVFGWALSGALFLFGVYLAFIDRTQKMLAEHQVRVSRELASARRQEREKDEFNAYLAGFDAEERKILQAVREQDGIRQSTLRYKTNIPKTTLSLMLKDLERRNVITRRPVGKTKEVYLVLPLTARDAE